MKFKGELSFEVDGDLLERTGHKERIEELHEILNEIYKNTYPVYIYDLLNDISNTVTTKKGDYSYRLKDGSIKKWTAKTVND